MDYQYAYHTLFNAATDALREMTEMDEARIEMARTILIRAQQDCEECYLHGEPAGE